MHITLDSENEAEGKIALNESLIEDAREFPVAPSTWWCECRVLRSALESATVSRIE